MILQFKNMMKRFYASIGKAIQIISLVSLFSTFGFAQVNHNSTKNNLRPYRFIFSINLFHSIKTEDAVASTKILINKIKVDNNLAEDIEIKICENVEEILSESKKDFDCLIATSIETSALRKSGNVKPVLVNLTQGSYGYVYYLISNKKQDFQNISDLKNGGIKILARSAGQVPSLWLDKILRDNHLPVKEKFFNLIEYDYKTTNIVLPVFFNKVPAAIVSKADFELICELNPQIEKQTNILATSNKLINSLFAHSKNVDPDLVYTYRVISEDLHKQPDGKQILTLFKTAKVDYFTQAELQETEKLIKRHNSTFKSLDD